MNMTPAREGLPESVVIPRELIEQAIRYMAPDGLKVGENMRRHVAAELRAALSPPATRSSVLKTTDSTGENV